MKKVNGMYLNVCHTFDKFDSKIRYFGENDRVSDREHLVCSLKITSQENKIFQTFPTKFENITLTSMTLRKKLRKKKVFEDEKCVIPIYSAYDYMLLVISLFDMQIYYIYD